MTSPAFFLEIFGQRREKYRADLETCRVEFSETAVHDLRVTTRRLLAALELLRVFDSHPRIQKLRRSLKSQLDGFDDLRDVQVMLVSLSRFNENPPTLEPFKGYLQKRERRLLLAAEKHVRAIETAIIDKRLLKARATLAAVPAEDLSPRLLQALDKAYLTVKQRYGWIDPDQSATIHQVRVAFKKFRYMLECIHPSLPNFPTSQLKRMQAYQTKMGNVQDAEVFLQTLAKFSERHKKYDPQPVRRLLEQGFTQALSVYLDGKGELDTFWRSAPESGFPWDRESKNEVQI